MTEFSTFRGRNRDQQDQSERGVWGDLQYVEGAGGMMTVRGTGTIDYEVPVINLGYGFNLETNSNAEVIMVSMGSDPNLKMAFPTLARDKQHPWGVGEGGIQHPEDPERRVEFNGDETFLRDGKFVIGTDREVEIEVDGSNVMIKTKGDANLETAGAVTVKSSKGMTFDAGGDVDFKTSGKLTHNGRNVGEDHTHGGVDAGGDDTGEPNV